MKQNTRKIMVQSTLLLISVVLLANVVGGLGGGIVHAASVTTFSNTYGGSGDEQANSVIQTSDGGYALAGSIQSSSGEAYWLVKTDANGDAQWNQTYGSSGDNYATSLIQTSDGGYAVTGFTDASGAGGYDFYLVKTTSNGATSTSSAFSWDSLEGFLIIGAIVFILLGVILFIIARTRKPTSFPH